MTIAIMQPYFFPYIGYFELIAQSDSFIIFDTSQYTTRTWMNRNRIQKPFTKKNSIHNNSHNEIIAEDKSWQYFTLDLQKAPQQTKIHDMLLLDKQKSYKKIHAQLQHYKKYAPFYKEVIHILDTCFENTKTHSLVDINTQSLKAVCDYLNISFNPIIFSKENTELPPIEHAGQWALEIATHYKARKYLNPPAGKHLFKEEEFKNKGIELAFTSIPNFTYKCKPYTFEPLLSILDVLLWCEKEKITDFLYSKV